MITRPGRRGAYSKTPRQREKILDAAMAVFGQRGNRGSSLREIAERVGMSQAGLLHHFGSKNQLLLAVLERFDQEEQPDSPPRSVAEGIAYVREELIRGLDRPGLFQLQVTMSAEATDPAHPAHDHFVAHYRRVSTQFCEAIDGAVHAGQIRGDVDVPAMARLIMAVLDGLQLQKLLNEDVDVLTSIDLMFDGLLAAYGADDAGVTERPAHT
ncbi:TetR/AcrR family transcriptional regulator [Janibacter cremeus]|uniref:AcrR family transcriptional regulator n=1 Tax=Janibacter cremeus TaxID=1285192 RepID=A0A852VTX1_9MICO|nr:TetR/AcrR family transcriptional regulator [Janibacter cremeus]NYF98840.1 AcrR family transcriptional regulator [Janibacter cremeus]